jgi:PAS domain S-box-containing protein
MALLFSITIGIVVALGSPSVQAHQNNSKESVRVIILKNFPPQFVTTEDGPSGLAVEMIREVAQRASLKIEFVTLNSWKEVYEPLKNGSVDLISNMGISKARKKILEFTDPYEVFDIKIFVRTETHDIKTIDDLKGRLLGVQTTNVLTTGLVKSGDYQIKQYVSFKLALLGLLSGEVDAVPAPTKPFLLIARGARLDDRIKFVGTSLLEIKRAIALPKGRTELRDRLNKSLREFKQTDGYQKLLTKWYGSATPYWTTTRLAMFMGIAFATSILIMVIWRYYSIIGLNHRIHESENQKKLIIQTVPDLIWSKNTEGVYLACNAKFERLYGAAEAQIIGKTDYDFFDRDIADAIVKQDKLAIKDKSLTYETEVTFADDGHKEVMLMTKTLMKSVDGIVLGTLGVGRDITKRKQAEDTLRESEAKFSSIYDQSPLGIELYDSEGNLVNANSKCLEMFGIDDITAVQGFKLFEDPNISDEVKERLLAGEPVSYASEFDFDKIKELGLYKTSKSGKIFVQVFLSPWKTRSDDQDRFLVHVMDITVSKQVEKELEKYREHLEKLVKERTAELEEKNTELERMNDVFIGREFRIKELKDRIKKLDQDKN